MLKSWYQKDLFLLQLSCFVPLLYAGLFPEREENQTGQEAGGVRTYHFAPPLKSLGILLTPGNSRQNRPSPLETPQNFVPPRPLEIPNDFFLMTPENSTLFLINPGKPTCYFFNTPGNSISSTSPAWFFSGIANYQIISRH